MYGFHLYATARRQSLATDKAAIKRMVTIPEKPHAPLKKKTSRAPTRATRRKICARGRGRAEEARVLRQSLSRRSRERDDNRNVRERLWLLCRFMARRRFCS